ncbi:MAG: DUF975 family protein [Clostridiales bacterium]|nr:DUF975 family protein [Clostridiales bacterium]
MWKRKELKQDAKAALKRNYWKTVLVAAIFTSLAGGMGVMSSTGARGMANAVSDTAQTGNAAVSMSYSSQIADFVNSMSFGTLVSVALILCAFFAVVLVLALLAKIFIANPVEVGIFKYKINAINGTGRISDLGEGFDVSYKRNVKVIFLRDLFIVLWSMLFVIPGIVKSYEYRMVPYILADNPDMDRKEVFKRSKNMMIGNKWRAFVLDLSFILWDLLGLITCGIVSLLYVEPYKHLTGAALYEAINADMM